MKAISAYITGFYRSSFHAYTTEVNVDGHRWRLGLRYSKFHEFYDQLVATEKDFHAEFPPKGSLFFTPKPEERQKQLEVFLQHVLVYYATKGYSAEVEDLLCNLLKVPRHLRSPEHEDDDVSTSTESVLDEPMHEPPSSSDSVEEAHVVEEKTAVVETKVAEQVPVQEAELRFPVTKEEKVVDTPEPVQPVSPVALLLAEEPRPVEELVAHEEAEVETPVSADEAEEVAKEEVATTVEKEEVQEEDAEPVAAQVPVEEPATEPTVEETPKEEVVEDVAAEQVAEAVAEARPNVLEVASNPVIKPVEQEEKPTPSKPLPSEESAASESTLPKENMEQKELATRGRLSSWIAAYLPKSLLGFIRRRCMKKTNLVVLCVALLLPMVLARR